MKGIFLLIVATITAMFVACAPEPIRMAFSNDRVSVVYQNGFEYELDHTTRTVTINQIVEPGEVPDPIFTTTGTITAKEHGVFVFNGPHNVFTFDVENGIVHNFVKQ